MPVSLALYMCRRISKPVPRVRFTTSGILIGLGKLQKLSLFDRSRQFQRYVQIDLHKRLNPSYRYRARTILLLYVRT